MKRLWPYLTLTALALIVWPSIMTPGTLLCTAVDAGHFLYRLHEIAWLFEHGVIWPRWAPNWSYGYGYPIFTFYGSLAFYPSLILHRVGLSLGSAFQAGFWLALVFSGWTAYLWLRAATGNYAAALIGAAAYMFVPYHLNATIYRINLPEPWAFVWAPLALYGLHRLVTDLDRHSLIITALAIAALPLTSNLAALVFAPLLITYALLLLVQSRRRATWGRLLAGATLTAGLAAGLAAFFLLPAWVNRTAVQIERGFAAGGVNVFRQFIPLSRVFQQPLLADLSRVNPLYDPLSLGWIIPSITVVALAIGQKRLSSTQRGYMIWAAAATVVCALLATRIAAPVYRALPFLQVLQFGWRFLAPATLAVAMLVALAARACLPAERPITPTLVALSAIVISSWPLLYPGTFCPFITRPTLRDAVAAQVGMVGTISTNAEYLPVTVQEIPRTSPMFDDYMNNKPVIRWDTDTLPDGGQTLAVDDNGLRATWQIDTPTAFEAIYRAFYFPGWQARIDGRRVALHPVAPYGLIGIDVPTGFHTIEVYFGPLPGQTVGEVISALSALSTLALLLWPTGLAFRHLRIPARRHPQPAACTEAQPRSPQAEPLSGRWIWAVAPGVLLFMLRVLVVDPLDGLPRVHRFDGTRVRGVEHSVAIDYIGGPRLLGYDLINQPSSGRALHLDLYWASSNGMPFRAFLRLVDEQGVAWTGWDTITDLPGLIGPPAPSVWDHRYTTLRYQIDIPPGTPPGIYYLSVAAVEPKTLVNYFVAPGMPANAERTEAIVGEITVKRQSANPRQAAALAQPNAPVSIDETLSMIRCERSHDAAYVGEILKLTMLWYAHQKPRIRSFTLRLLDANGEIVLEQTHPLSARYGVEAWQTGELVRAPVEILVPAHLSAGEYRWVMQVGTAAIDLGNLRVDVPLRQSEFPPNITRVEQTLDGLATLVGYQAGELRAGQPLPVTLYWRAQAETSVSYKVFVHLIDAQGHPVAQSDAVPANWTRPTTGWLPPEIVTDAHTLVIPTDLATGPYRLVAGLYDPRSGQRAVTAEGIEQIVLETLSP